MSKDTPYPSSVYEKPNHVILDEVRERFGNTKYALKKLYSLAPVLNIDQMFLVSSSLLLFQLETPSVQNSITRNIESFSIDRQIST